MRSLVAAFALTLVAGAAHAADSRLTLAEPREGVKIIDGATWRCQGKDCTAKGGKEQPPLRACKRVVAQLGRAEAFTHRGRDLPADKLAECNGAAK
jgi:hypothetical protein